MGILWLIIKTILFVLLGILLLLILLLLIILLAPIRYEVYFEKYDDVEYEAEISYLKWIRGRFVQANGIKNHEVKAFGKVFYKNKGEKIEEESVKNTNNQKEKTPIKHEVKNEVSLPKEIKKGNINTVLHHSKSIQRNKKVETIKKTEIIKKIDPPAAANDIKDETIGTVKNAGFTQIKELFLNQAFIKVLQQILISSKYLIKYIMPREWSYEIIIGQEDPADTGELIAKLTMLYPLYYRKGIIRGNYEEEGIWGGFLANGKFRVIGIIRIIVRLLLNKIVREYIKKIIEIRKEERNG